MSPLATLPGPAVARPAARWAPLAMLLAGAVQTASFAPTEAWYLQLLAMAALAATMGSARPRRAAGLGWCFGVGWLVSGLWWLYISMHDFGNLPAPMAALAVLLLAAALSLYYALAMALYAALRRGRPLADGLLFAACWLLAELARGQWLTGFPWIASGYAHTTGPLAGLAPWLGVYGITAAAALIGAAAAAVLRAGGRALPLLAVAVVLPLAGWLLPGEFTTSTGRLAVSLLQPNVAQDLKFDPERIVANMRNLLARVQASQGRLVVTPESVVPLPKGELDPAFWAQLTAPFRSADRAALIGLFLGDEKLGYTNSMVGIAARPDGMPAAADYEYGKRHLLPFGEVIPPGFHWFVELMQIPLGDQEHGSNTASFHAAGQRLRPLICYEDLFGEDFAASVVGPGAATVLVNASNLAWFGRWMMQDQHLQFSRMRSLEFQRPLVRSTNTGATAVVDHHGRVTARLPPLVAGTLEAEVEGRSGATPYARWLAAWGLWPAWLAALAVIALTRFVRPARR